MPEQSFQTLQSSVDMTKLDITLLTIQTRGLYGMLFKSLSRKQGDIYRAYNDFIELFSQLYLSFKYNAGQTKRLKDWDKKVVFFDNLFYNRLMVKSEFIPEIMLKAFDMFLEDLIKTGIYNLAIGQSHLSSKGE